MDPKTLKFELIKKFRRHTSPKGDRYDGPPSRELLLAYNHAKGMPHARAEPFVAETNLPWAGDILSAYELVAEGLPVPTQEELKAWATVPVERQRKRGLNKHAERAALPPKKKRVARLFLVVRENLPPGDQAVQAAHALQEFVEHHRAENASWFKTSNTLALLAARDEDHLLELVANASKLEIPTAPFREPDLADSLTAVAFSPRAARLVRGLPLALRG